MSCEHYNLLQETFAKIAPLEGSELEMAYPYIHFKAYAPKEYIFERGDFVSDVHFLISGVGRYFYIDSEGNEWNKSLVKQSGAFSSVSSLVEGSASTFYAQALTQSLVAAIKYEHLILLAKESDEWADFLRKLYERLTLKKEKREASFLLLNARERYEEFLLEFGSESELIPLRHVAMYLGVTDVTLSRIRKEMGLT
ncbi:hypothetical protein BZG09_16035 [Salinivibrio kushneri]|uniref:Cyclic nucleotide-binding domain-containing protein n=2 Tax=Salinivibrio kushneri TaxID=1908198 RepID=A0AB36K1M5_9GAMM|nr:hypothetical protein BZG09_16035 [Salinivibrio kushneri]